MDYLLKALWAVTPTICVGLIFWYVMRAIVRSDRGERAEYAKIEQEERDRLSRQHAQVRDQENPGATKP